MAFSVAPPKRLKITAILLAMKPNTDRLFTEGTRDSIKAVASRVGTEYGRKYQTAKDGNGVRVWRLE